MNFKKHACYEKCYENFFKFINFTKFELVFCIMYMISALIICSYATPRGSLFSPDSTQYIYDAENFIKVFPFYYSAPIYPALISIGTFFGLTSEQSAGLVPILSYSLMGFPIYIIGKELSGPINGYLACIVCLICGEDILFLSAYALTDMPFILISTCALAILIIYTKYHIPILSYVAGLFVSFALFTRLIGMALIPVGIIALALSEKPLKKAMISILQFGIIPVISLIVWKLFMNKTYLLYSGVQISNNLDKLPIGANLIKFIEISQRFFLSKTIGLFILISLFCILIYLCYKKQLVTIINDSASIIGYLLIYSIFVIIATSNLPIGIESVPLGFRYIVPIYPSLVLMCVLLFYYVYINIHIKNYKSAYKFLSIILLILVLSQGANSLFIKANDIREKSIVAYSDQERLSEYISMNNITDVNTIYILNENRNHQIWPNYQIYLHIKSPTNDRSKYFHYIRSWQALPNLIKSNKNLPTYIIIDKNEISDYILNSSHNICLSKPYMFSDAAIFEASLPKGNNNCNLSFLNFHISNNPESIWPYLSGDFNSKNYLDRSYDQLLMMRTNRSNSQRDESSVQILNFISNPLQEQIYSRSERIIGDIAKDSSESLFAGDFMGLCYDQVFSIACNSDNTMINIEDFSQGSSPAIIRYSEALSNSSPLKNLTDPEDAQLAGDFLALGHSQVLFMDRSSNEKRLVLADFAKNKSAQFTEIPLTGESSRIARWLDKDDLQLTGDFMGLGHSQVLFINRNHTKDEKELLIILDFSSTKDAPSIKYLENWGDSSKFSGWIDANDTQLVGDFMRLGYSQVLFINHRQLGGKIEIIDFSKSGGKPPASVAFKDEWNGSDLFEGWMNLNDTMIAGDFKAFGYSQVLFLNSSSNGTNATIVEFASGKPLIAI